MINKYIYNFLKILLYKKSCEKSSLIIYKINVIFLLFVENSKSILKMEYNHRK